MTSRRVAFARSQRQSMGLAERKVWELVRDRRVDGHKFRKQHPVGRYFADFACERLRLIVEIDGGVHDRDEVVVKDHWRQQALEDLGWTVVRFTNEVALGQPEKIAAAIRDHAGSIGL